MQYARDIRNAYRTLIGKPGVIDHLGDLGIDLRTDLHAIC
jgi:hypothetical protein